MRGVLVTFEGPEGSGKSTQVRWLAGALRHAGRRVVLLKDPGSTALGQALRRVLLHLEGPLAPLQEALLFIGGRVALVEERIRPALARGAVVVCDRFHDSTMAYQGFGSGLDEPRLQRVGRQAIGGLMPDLTLLLDLPVEQGLARLRRRPDRMERRALAFHRRVRAGYRALARREPRRIVIVDATQPPAVVRRRIAALLARRLPR